MRDLMWGLLSIERSMVVLCHIAFWIANWCLLGFTAAVAMHFLKTALNIPVRMGWNGDPCSPTVWDSWEGVTCNPGSDGSSLVVTHM